MSIKFLKKFWFQNPHKVIAIKLSSNSYDGLNAKLSLNRPKDRGEPTVNVFTNKDNLLIMQGKVTQRGGKVDSQPSPILDGVQFETCLKIKHKGGQVFRGKDYLELIGVKTANTFYCVQFVLLF